ncbi:MAG: VRR-NUC domain-containing protein [Eubacteriales bacterium]
MTTSPTPSRPAPTARELEASLEAYFQNQVRLHGGMVEKLVSTRRGIPDRLVLFPGGRMYLVELKRMGGRTSAIQEAWHARARGLGTHVAVLEGRGAVNAWLRSVFGEIDRAVDGPSNALAALDQRHADADPRTAARRLNAARSAARKKLSAGKPLTEYETLALRSSGEL